MSEEQLRIMEENDRITGLKMKDYLLTLNFEGMMNFLEGLSEARKDSNVIDMTMKAAAKECDLDPE